ncbi:MAG: hypothetical protein SVV80_02210 [Planctomycetota bacterium]|nr:hypothetical protein [Planctomycetota bacterium]
MVERKIISLSSSSARWLMVMLLAVIVVMLGRELVSSAPQADAQTGWSGQDGKVFAIAGQVTKDTYGLYLVDMKNGTICVYQFLNNGRLKLMAARTFIYDCQLDSYNTEPLPQDVAKLVARARRLKDINTTTGPRQ